jgi:TolB-like protein/DNA-binding winged helix-turn-helix (wHTH) protein
MLRIGEWCVNPTAGQISRDGHTLRLEARTMRLLLYLAERAGEVVSIDDLLNHVWSGVNVSPDSVYQAVASLRRVLGDDPRQPTYIATAPRLGYRMVAPVEPWQDPHLPIPPAATVDGPTLDRRVPARLAWSAAATVCLAVVVGFVAQRTIPTTRHPSSLQVVEQKSVAVLPFLDLTEGMKEEEFADGVTEELIDRLSKIPGLRVPAPTSSFYFKGRKLAVVEIAKVLGVAYVLDGSVRKSGARVRVAARLIRADDEHVVWSETYDRPWGDMLVVQDEIAGEVIKALRAALS